MTDYLICAMRGRNSTNPSERKKSNGLYRQRIEINWGGNEHDDNRRKRQLSNRNL